MDAKERLARRIKLHDLTVLLAAAEFGSLAKAAKHLALTQPAISKTVGDLEAKLGTRLLDRSTQGVAPTAAGKTLLFRARNVFAELRYVMDEIEDLNDPHAGVLRIGCGPIFAAGLLPAIMGRLLRERTGLRYYVFEAAQANVLRSRVADILLGRPPPADDNEDIEFEQLFEEKLFVVAGVNHPLAQRRKISKEELAKERWVLPLPYAETSIGQIIEPALAHLGIAAQSVTVKSMSGLLLFSLLASGRFLSTLPGSVLHFSDWRRAVRILPIVLPRATGPVGLTTVRGVSLPPTAQLFAQYAREVAKEMHNLDPSTFVRARSSSHR